MAYQPVPSVVGVEVRGTVLAQQTENLLYYRYDGALSDLMLSTLVDNISSVVEETWLAVLPSGWTGREVYGRDLAAEIAMQYTNDDINGVTGLGAGGTSPSFVTKAIARRSGMTGRASRGRIFWQGLSTTWISGNIITTSVLDLMVVALQTADLAAVSAGFEPVIVSRTGPGATPSAAFVYDLDQWIYTSVTPDTRRSRKVGVGV